VDRRALCGHLHKNTLLLLSHISEGTRTTPRVSKDENFCRKVFMFTIRYLVPGFYTIPLTYRYSALGLTALPLSGSTVYMSLGRKAVEPRADHISTSDVLTRSPCRHLLTSSTHICSTPLFC
jgi:hypothetical protein